MLQLLQVAVELEMHPAGGESRDKDVGFTVVGLILLQVLVDHFECIIITDPNLTDVVKGLERLELLHFVNDLCVGLGEIFAKLTPKTIQYQLGSGFASWTLDNATGVKIDAFSLLVLPNVLGLVCGGDGPSGLAGRLLVNLEPSIHIVGKESLFALGKVPDLVDLDEGVSQVDGFQDLGGAPGSMQRRLLGGVLAETRFLQQWFSHLFFHAGSTEGKSEFALMSVWQEGMVQVVG